MIICQYMNDFFISCSKALQVEANNLKSLCNEASILGDEIKDFNNSPELEDNINKKLESLKKPVDDALALLDEREKKLKDQLQETGAFKDQFDDIERRLKNFESSVGSLQGRPISAKSQKASVLLSEIEVNSDLLLEILVIPTRPFLIASV